MRLRCRLGWHKWSKPKVMVVKGIAPLTYRGCLFCTELRVR